MAAIKEEWKIQNFQGQIEKEEKYMLDKKWEGAHLERKKGKNKIAVEAIVEQENDERMGEAVTTQTTLTWDEKEMARQRAEKASEKTANQPANVAIHARARRMLKNS